MVPAVEVACIACSRTFDACGHPGLIRCASCEQRSGLALPSTGIVVLTIDTPGEAWS